MAALAGPLPLFAERGADPMPLSIRMVSYECTLSTPRSRESRQA